MLPNHAQTETVDRRDLRVMDQSRLHLEVSVIRMFGKPLLNRRADSLSHLRRRRFRERHHKKTVNIERFLPLRHKLDDSLDEDGGLSASRCRTHEQIFSPAFNHLLLLSRPLNRRFRPFRARTLSRALYFFFFSL